MSDARDLRTLYETVYADVSPAHEAVRRDGHLAGDDIGQCGYTLPEQLRHLAELMRLGPGKRFLDIGCGRGGPTRYLEGTAGCAGIGVDFAFAGVARAWDAEEDFTARSLRSLEAQRTQRKREEERSVRFLVADVCALPVRAECVDAVVSFDLFLYIRDREALVAECRRVLRPGGWLAIVDEVERGGGSAQLGAEEREARALFGPAVYDTEASHCERLRRAGFAVDAVEDWTPAFVALNNRWCAARERHREALVAEVGEDGYEAGQRYFATNRDAAAAGRLGRMLFLARRID